MRQASILPVSFSGVRHKQMVAKCQMWANVAVTALSSSIVLIQAEALWSVQVECFEDRTSVQTKLDQPESGFDRRYE